MKRIKGFTKPTTCFSFNGLPWLCQTLEHCSSSSQLTVKEVPGSVPEASDPTDIVKIEDST